MSIGQRISKLRKENNLSQEYIAERLGVSRQAVSKWETDRSAPDTYNLISLAELFGVSVEYIAVGKLTENNQEIKSADVEKTENNQAIKTSEAEKQDFPSRKSSLSTQRIIGVILLCAGLLSVVLGIVFLFVFEDDLTASFLLFFLSYGLIIGGVLLITLRKNSLAFAILVLFASIFLILAFSIYYLGAICIIISIVLFVAAFKIKKKKVD